MSFLIALRIVICLICINGTKGQCAFPSQLTGVWKGADRGDVTFANSTFMQQYAVMIPTVTQFNFICLEQRGSKYFLKAIEENNIFGIIVKFYMCLEMYGVDSDIAYYYQLTDRDPFLRDNIVGIANADGTYDEVCTGTAVTRNFVTLVRDGSIADGSMNNTCPDELQALFGNVSIQHEAEAAATICPGTVFDVCTDNTLVNITYNATCATTTEDKTLSVGGIYRCIHSITEGSTTFLSIWNDDAGVTQPFSCFAFQRISDTIYATESPRYCSNSSTSTAAETSGVKMIIWDIMGTCEIILPKIRVYNYIVELNLIGGGNRSTWRNPPTCPTTEAPVNLAGLWALMILPALFLILFFILLTIYCYRRHGCICKKIKFPKKKKKEPPVTDDGTGKPDTVGKITFVPSVIKPAKLYNFRQKKQLNCFPLFDPNWNPTDVPNLQPVAKVEPLYHDTLDDYMKGNLPRRPSGSSLYSFHSGLITNGFVP